MGAIVQSVLKITVGSYLQTNNDDDDDDGEGEEESPDAEIST